MNDYSPNPYDLCMCRPGTTIVVLTGLDQVLVGPSMSRKAIVIGSPSSGQIVVSNDAIGTIPNGIVLRAGDPPLLLDRDVYGQLVSGEWRVLHFDLTPFSAGFQDNNWAARASAVNGQAQAVVAGITNKRHYISCVVFSFSPASVGVQATIEDGAQQGQFQVLSSLVVPLPQPLRCGLSQQASATLPAGGVGVTGSTTLFGFTTPAPTMLVTEILRS